MQTITAQTKMRIDKYLEEKTNNSRAQIQKLIKVNNVLVNGKQTKANYILKINDTIEINDVIPKDNHIKEEKMDLDIIFEDDDLIVINKPSGLVVHPAPGHKEGTLVNGLLGYTKNLSNNDNRPGIVHRIDKNTSGLLLVAKNTKAHAALVNQLKLREIKRIYIALVDGVINHDTGTINAPIGRDIKNRKKMMVTDINAKEAITNFKVLKRYANATLIECSLQTGRTHQIRAHMQYIGHPIINDPTYSNKKSSDYGQLLHAQTLTFNHPITKEKMTLTKDIPNEFKELLKDYE